MKAEVVGRPSVVSDDILKVLTKKSVKDGVFRNSELKYYDNATEGKVVEELLFHKRKTCSNQETH
jgi:hypothetical protein